MKHCRYVGSLLMKKKPHVSERIPIDMQKANLFFLILIMAVKCLRNRPVPMTGEWIWLIRFIEKLFRGYDLHSSS